MKRNVVALACWFLSLCVAFGIGRLTVGQHTAPRGSAASALDEQTSEITARYARDWDARRGNLEEGTPAWDEARAEWRWRYDAEMRGCYVRHHKEPPPHLRRPE